MTDEKATFVEDLRYKKGLARSSRYRICGSKSKHCSLPSDSLTAAQRRKLNGEVMEYKIGQRITWEEFKTYPPEMQKKYLQYFADNHGASTGMICALFNRSQPVVSSYFKDRGLGGILNRQPKKEAMERFNDWLSGTDEQPVVAEVPPVPIEVKPVVVEKVVKPEQPYFVHTLLSGNMELSGTATEIFQTLFGIFRDAQLSLSVNFQVIPPAPVAEVIEEPSEEDEQIEEPNEDDGLVNLNTCVFKDLRAVGISPNIAATIIQTRPFSSVEELRGVPGITDVGFAIISKRVKV
jgi:DNA uptake protein ComE-like DNA-binding protein